MKENTSGILTAENADGSLVLGYIDYGVEFFGGGDYEVTIALDADNAKLLKASLADIPGESLKEKLEKVFTAKFDENKFERFCGRNGIVFRRSSWVSGAGQ